MAGRFLPASAWAKRALRPCITDVQGRRKMSPPNKTTLGHAVPAYFKKTSKIFPAISKDLVSTIEKLENEQSLLVTANQQRVENFSLLHFGPYLTQSPVIKTEADVVRESHLELVNWVCLVLEFSTGFKIRVLSDRRKKDKPDMVWFYVVPGESAENIKNWMPFAGLEFKNTKIIDVDGFQPAVFDESMGKTEDQFDRASLRGPNDTLIKGDNAIWLTKQMISYAKMTGVPHQVAFDYFSMLSLDFESDLVKDPGTPPKSSQIGWLREESKSGSDFQTHRAYLLGYLSNALQETTKRQGITSEGHSPVGSEASILS